MTWAAMVKDRRDDGTALVILSDGARDYTQWFLTDGTRASLRVAVLGFIAGQTQRDAKKSDITPGLVIDCTPDPMPDPPKPTDAELARAQFFADLFDARQQEKVNTLPPDLAARCLPEYVDGL